jgi:DNA repair exonuclease SbcCD ATPase subunit
MEITFDTIINLLTLLGGGGLGWFFSLKYARRKQNAEAVSAEAEAAKELQDVYQQLINDVKTDRDEQKAYINELKEDRAHLREERNELRERQDKLEEQVRTLQFDVARNSRIVAFMGPYLCGREGCPTRVPITISSQGKIEYSHKKEEMSTKDDDVLRGIEPNTGPVF